MLDQALSFAGGISLAAGRIIDIRAPQRGECVAGRILVMPVGRGSSTSSSVLAECIRLGVAPNAILLPGVDQILAVGSLVARTLYGKVCPIIAVDPDDLASIRTGAWVTITADGSFTAERV